MITYKKKIIFCGDININYLASHNRRQQLYTLLALYNLKSTVTLSTRNFNGSNIAIYNTFIAISRYFTIKPSSNGLSGHDAQVLKLDVIVAIQEFTSCYVRNINSFTVDEFQSKLSTENWEDIFVGSDTNVIFNNFLNNYLKIFYACSTKSTLNSTHR